MTIHIRSTQYIRFVLYCYHYHDYYYNMIEYVFWQATTIRYIFCMEVCLIYYGICTVRWYIQVFSLYNKWMNYKTFFLFCRGLEKNSPRVCAGVLEDKTGGAWKTCQPSCWKASSDYNSCSVIFVSVNNVIFALSFYSPL